jgi:hypothetical protein
VSREREALKWCQNGSLQPCSCQTSIAAPATLPELMFRPSFNVHHVSAARSADTPFRDGELLFIDEIGVGRIRSTWIVRTSTVPRAHADLKFRSIADIQFVDMHSIHIHPQRFGKGRYL